MTELYGPHSTTKPYQLYAASNRGEIDVKKVDLWIPCDPELFASKLDEICSALIPDPEKRAAIAMAYAAVKEKYPSVFSTEAIGVLTRSDWDGSKKDLLELVELVEGPPRVALEGLIKSLRKQQSRYLIDQGTGGLAQGLKGAGVDRWFCAGWSCVEESDRPMLQAFIQRFSCCVPVYAANGSTVLSEMYKYANRILWPLFHATQTVDEMLGNPTLSTALIRELIGKQARNETLTEPEKNLFDQMIRSMTATYMYDAVLENEEDQAELNQQWQHYQNANKLFALEIARNILIDLKENPGMTPVVWVHDFHLILVPRYLKELLPHVPVAFQLHIPFPPVSVFNEYPYAGELLESLLAADQINFHVDSYRENFIQLVKAAKRDFVFNHLTQAFTRPDGSSLNLYVRHIGIDYDGLNGLPAEEESEKIKKFLAEKRLARKLELQIYAEQLASLGISLSEEDQQTKVLFTGGRADVIKAMVDSILGFSYYLRHLKKAFDENYNRVKTLGVLSAEDGVLLRDLYRQLNVTYVMQTIRNRQGNAIYDGLWFRCHALQVELGSLHGNAVFCLFDENLSSAGLTTMYRYIDIHVVASIMDGFNMMAVESMAAATRERLVLILSEMMGVSQTFKATGLSAHVIALNNHVGTPSGPANFSALLDQFFQLIRAAVMMPLGEVERHSKAIREALAFAKSPAGGRAYSLSDWAEEVVEAALTPEVLAMYALSAARFDVEASILVVSQMQRELLLSVSEHNSAAASHEADRRGVNSQMRFSSPPHASSSIFPLTSLRRGSSSSATLPLGSAGGGVGSPAGAPWPEGSPVAQPEYPVGKFPPQRPLSPYPSLTWSLGGPVLADPFVGDGSFSGAGFFGVRPAAGGSPSYPLPDFDPTDSDAEDSSVSQEEQGSRSSSSSGVSPFRSPGDARSDSSSSSRASSPAHR